MVLYPNMDIWIAFSELPQNGKKKTAKRNLCCTNRNCAALQFFAQIEFTFCTFNVFKCNTNMGEERFPFRGQLYTMMTPHKQATFELVLQTIQRTGHVGLR